MSTSLVLSMAISAVCWSRTRDNRSTVGPTRGGVPTWPVDWTPLTPDEVLDTSLDPGDGEEVRIPNPPDEVRAWRDVRARLTELSIWPSGAIIRSLPVSHYLNSTFEEATDEIASRIGRMVTDATDRGADPDLVVRRAFTGEGVFRPLAEMSIDIVANVLVRIPYLFDCLTKSAYLRDVFLDGPMLRAALKLPTVATRLFSDQITLVVVNGSFGGDPQVIFPRWQYPSCAFCAVIVEPPTRSPEERVGAAPPDENTVIYCARGFDPRETPMSIFRPRPAGARSPNAIPDRALYASLDADETIYTQCRDVSTTSSRDEHPRTLVDLFKRTNNGAYVYALRAHRSVTIIPKADEESLASILRRCCCRAASDASTSSQFVGAEDSLLKRLISAYVSFLPGRPSDIEAAERRSEMFNDYTMSMLAVKECLGSSFFVDNVPFHVAYDEIARRDDVECRKMCVALRCVAFLLENRSFDRRVAPSASLWTAILDRGPVALVSEDENREKARDRPDLAVVPEGCAEMWPAIRRRMFTRPLAPTIPEAQPIADRRDNATRTGTCSACRSEGVEVSGVPTDCGRCTKHCRDAYRKFKGFLRRPGYSRNPLSRRRYGEVLDDVLYRKRSYEADFFDSPAWRQGGVRDKLEALLQKPIEEFLAMCPEY